MKTRILAASAVLAMLLLPLAGLALAQPVDADPATTIGSEVSAPGEVAPSGDATVLVPTVGGEVVAVEPVPAPADVPAASALPKAVPIAAVLVLPIWLLTFLVKKYWPDVRSDQIAVGVGIVLGAVTSLLAYLTGALPNTTWLQTILSIVTSFGGATGGVLGAAALHEKIIKPLKGEPSVSEGIPGPQGARGLRGRPGERGLSTIGLLLIIVLVLVLWGGGFAFHVGGSAIHLLLLVLVIIVVLALVRGRGGELDL